uniref:Integrase catalytic domain-containing protein n=1 Tax=Monopterus albus TaxID=43700 RepID=A0A3Q3Q0K8_MONAL
MKEHAAIYIYICARHGFPQCVMSDNGPQYSCSEFKDFAYGKAEKGVQIVKRLFRKAADSNTDHHLALLSYRAAPLECGKSPAEPLMNRKLLLHYHTYRKGIMTKQRLECLQENDATVLQEVGPRLFKVKPEDGQVLRRNRESLLKTPEKFEEPVQDIEPDKQSRSLNLPHDELVPEQPKADIPVLRRSTRPRKPPERLIEQG